MSETLTLARPYARAAFESARDGNALAAWSANLGFTAQAVADAHIGALIGNPRLSNDELVGLLLPPGEAASGAFANFLSLLADNRRLALLPDVAALFEELKRESERVLKVTLRSATEIPAQQADAIKVALAKRFGRNIELDQRIDPSVIGGAVIDAGDVVIDGSVRGRLARLESALLQ
ncbi:MAG: F0F1 ATP synthase subunit delta [Rudaea sp.]|uniref:F0F1 ATP synthase subunit delta n=1 Tax=unclassified Rudaea TaxID=2627037 RepID=UPI0010F697E9|nr:MULTISPECIES: F0F1 ATP synthase subunit delta [unclassified Rudaea]MBN8887235.1 F0F1 ATP synthase subunit delta [Rudaea sp.]MBR0344892.1 F0F1 ATP synthase subunit delta [Rudaea sp.]